MMLRSILILLALVLGAGASSAGDEPHRRLVIGGDCVSCDFEGANLAGANFLGGDFTGADFQRAELLGARLSDMNLTGANFESASLIDARLANVIFDAADLSDVQLNNARLHNVRLRGAKLERADLSGAVMLLSDFADADLSGARCADTVFRQADLTGARLREARFSEAHFFGARLAGADMRSARLNQAIIENSDLSGADLRGARLAGAQFIAVNLTGVDLRGAEGLDEVRFQHSCGAGIDGLPEGVQLQACSAEGIRQVVAAISVDAERLERRRAELEHARTAIARALSDAGVQAQLSRTMRAEVTQALREGWREAAEAIAEAEIDVRTELAAERAGRWSFEIRREEIGEPMRIILEQIERGDGRRVIVSAGAPTPPAAPTPPVAPAPPDSTKPRAGQGETSDEDANSEDGGEPE